MSMNKIQIYFWGTSENTEKLIEKYTDLSMQVASVLDDKPYTKTIELVPDCIIYEDILLILQLCNELELGFMVTGNYPKDSDTYQILVERKGGRFRQR